ncbi:MAG: heme ABC transporter ATP-binding protein [Candidatus Devosia euplotis]|nr:heme ABC transporter ATP-binding protein [Candidatus Devosia euplotis]
MISVDNIAVDIGSRRILEGITFTARPGQVTVAIGPNGSSKSSLLKTLCRDYSFGGSIAINSQNVASMSPATAATLRAALPQSSTLPFPFTVLEVVAMGLTAGRPGVTVDGLRRLPDDALERVDLSGFGTQFYGELSGGEQQRVQLASVICQVWQPVLDGAPRYLFLDEPVSSLDIKHQLMIMDVAREFASAGGGVIAILHDLNLAAMYADKIVALRDGRVAGIGPPAEVLRDELIAEVFDCPMRVGALPPRSGPFVLPQSVRCPDTVTLSSKVA